jgi:hypothetical protein
MMPRRSGASRVLRIREAQFHAFQQVSLDRFIDNTVNHLLEHFPDPCASALGGRTEVRAFVMRGLGRASAVNVNTPAAVTALLELWLQFGEDFERSPIRVWTMNMLSHPELPGATKVDVVRDRHLELTGGCVMVVY